MKLLSSPHAAFAGKLLFIAVVLVLAASIAPALRGGDAAPGGTAPYTPSRGEWLCLILNTERAQFNSEQSPLETQVRYRYDRSNPNTIQIEVLFGSDARDDEVARHAQEAQQRAQDTAKIYGWAGWLKTEVKKTRLSGPPAWEDLYH